MISFEQALDFITDNVHEINYPREPKNLYEPIDYLLKLKGKKIRPALTLLAYNLYREDKDIEQSVDVALAWEIFHNFTLMHDDVMDNADVRRGQPAVHKKWNENTAILSGDAMLILSYMYITKAPSQYLKVLLDLFSKTADEICRGQQYDMEFESRLDVSEADYINMIRLKTAVMVGACLQSGAIIAGASLEDQHSLYEFGINLGIAFQIRDDLLDVYGNPEVFGKKIGGDILCNKKTYLLINTLNVLSDEDKNALVKLLSTKEQTETKINSVKYFYTKYSIKEKAEEAIRIYYQKSLNALSKVNVDPERKLILMDLARDLMERES